MKDLIKYTLKEILSIILDKQYSTSYCLFYSFSGHVDMIRVYVYKSREDINSDIEPIFNKEVWFEEFTPANYRALKKILEYLKELKNE